MAENHVAEPCGIRIVKRQKPQTLLGCLFYGDPFHSKAGWDYENEIGLLWKRFMNLYGKHRKRLKRHTVDERMGYEVHIQPEDYRETKKFYVFVGVEVKSLEEAPLEMSAKILPAKMYAVFTFRGKEIFGGGKYIWQEWLPQSGKYEEAYPYFMEVYEEGRFKGFEDENSEIDYYVPIKKRGKRNEQRRKGRTS